MCPLTGPDALEEVTSHTSLNFSLAPGVHDSQSRRCLVWECCVRERRVIWSLPKSVILDFDQTRSRRFHRQGQVWEPDTVCTCVHACVSVLKPWQPFCNCPTFYQLPSNQTEWPFSTPSNNWKHLSNHLKCPSNHSASTNQSKFGQLFPCSCWVLCFMVWGECESHLLNCMTSATVPPQSGMVKYGCRWLSVMNPLSH